MSFIRMNLSELDLDVTERCAARRQYRSLRIAVYAPQSYTGPDHPSCQGFYGMSRHDARNFIGKFYRELAWLMYLGSK